MLHSFNLIDKPWIPVIGLDGMIKEASLHETIANAHQLRELSGESPLVIVALHRLLLAILHHRFGPNSPQAWGELWSHQSKGFTMETIDNYFADPKIYDRFDLFHPERPFMQMADNRVQPKTITAMIHDLASGNNATLFDHHTDADGIALTPAQAARYLLAAQAFGLAGLSGLDEKFSYAPCVGGVIFLVQGETLFETLLLNLIKYPPAEDLFPAQSDQDAPVWEQDDPFARDSTFPRGYVDYLTWQNRRIKLIPPDEQSGDGLVRQITMAPGLKLDGEVREPMKLYRRLAADRPLMALRFSEDRALWRDSSALFRLLPNDKTDFQPPHALTWNRDLVYRHRYLPERPRRIFALGMANDQAKTEFFRSERMPLHPRYLEDSTVVDALETLLKLAETVSNQLWGATNTLACYLVKPDYDPQNAKSKPKREDLDPLLGSWGALRYYWAQLETPFYQVLGQLPDDINCASDFWNQTLRNAAREAFNKIADNLQTTPRVLKATVQAQGQLEAGLKIAMPTA